MKTLRLEGDSVLIARPADALELVGATWGKDIDLVIVPVHRCHADFWNLSTGLLGEVLQKLATYRVRVAFVGDLRPQLDVSEPLRDFVRESNAGRQAWFCESDALLSARLAP